MLPIMRVSIRQVAQRAGVSPKTVSNVLLERTGRVSGETRQRVLEAVRELDYVPVRPAMQNRHVTTHVIGVVFDSGWESNAIGVQTLKGVRDGALKNDYDFLVMLRAHPPWMQGRAEARFLDRRCDGFIFIAPNDQHEILELLVKHQVPVVSCFRNNVPPGIAWVMTDNESTMRLAVEYLKKRGHTSIGHLAGASDSFAASRRRVGFLLAMQENGLVTNEGLAPQAHWHSHSPEARLAAKSLIDQKVTAIVCANDKHALTVWKLAAEMGLRIPQDLSIIGVDNSPEAAELGITSFTNASISVSYQAVESLVSLINGAGCQSVCKTIPLEIVERQSVRALNQ